MPNHSPLSPRKKPLQARSQATLEAILDAAAQVLVEEGLERATTNRIAELAGVSIGSLYQYFPNKEAIVAALQERHDGAMLEQLAEMAQKLLDAPLEEAVRAYVRAMLEAHALEPKLHQALTESFAVADLSRLRAMQQRAEALVRGYLEQHRERLRPRNLEVATFIIATAVEAVTHVAVLDRQRLLKDPAFAEEVSELVIRYLLKKVP